MKTAFLFPIVIFMSLPPRIYAQPMEGAATFLEQKMAEVKGETYIEPIDTSLPPPKCGTPIATAAYALGSLGFGKRFEALQDRPIDLPLTFGSTNFIIHYTDTGSDAPYQVSVDTDPADGVPDYINRAADIFEYVWHIEIDSAAFNSPPTDFMRGGDDRYDIYVTNLGFGYYGFTNPESTINSYRAFSFIEIENDFGESSRYRDNPLDGLRVTAAHEFFHAIQFGYDAFEFDADRPNDPTSYKPWWMEATSTWMEEIVFDNVNDYLGYLPFYYRYPWIGLGAFSYGADVRAFHPYGSCVWPIYLTERFANTGIVKEIWERCGEIGGYNTLPASNASLELRGSNLSAAFQEFAVWNFHTGSLADTVSFYSEGNSFPPMDTTYTISDLVASTPVTIPNTIQYPEQFAANYIIVNVDQSTTGGVVATFNGQGVGGQDWRAALLGYKSNDSRWRDLQINPSTGDGAGAWPGWNTYRSVILIPTVTGLNPTNETFVYTGVLSYDPSLEGGGTPGFGVAQAYPSPFIITGDDIAYIPYSLDKTYAKKNMGLWIFDVGGQLVREIPGELFLFTDPGDYPRGISWDGKNSAGEYVASGVYIYLFEAENKSDRGKIAVINNRQ